MKIKILFYLFFISIILPQILLSQSNWLGTFDGKKDPEMLHNYGDNILIVKKAYVWDNREGKKPTGKGSNYGFWGPFWKKHGPYGNFHVLIYAPDQKTLLGHTYLHGNWKTGATKWEWKDDEGLEYINYGIHDWDVFNYDDLYIIIYESDPSEWQGIKIPELITGRKHDIVMDFWVNRDESYCGVSYSNYNMPILELQTVDLSYTREWTKENYINIKNLSRTQIDVSVMICTTYLDGKMKWTEWLGPYQIYSHKQNPIRLIDFNGWKLKGEWMYIHAVSTNGRYIWDKDKNLGVYIGASCAKPYPGDFIYTFRK